MAGNTTFTVSAVLFRAWMVCQWALFLHEKRPFIRQRYQVRQFVGHLTIQTLFCIITIVAGVVGGFFSGTVSTPSPRFPTLLVSRHYLRLKACSDDQMISLAYALHDLFTEIWLVIDRLKGLNWPWTKLGSNESANSIELSARV